MVFSVLDKFKSCGMRILTACRHGIRFADGLFNFLFRSLMAFGNIFIKYCE